MLAGAAATRLPWPGLALLRHAWHAPGWASATRRDAALRRRA